MKRTYGLTLTVALVGLGSIPIPDVAMAQVAPEQLRVMHARSIGTPR